MEQVKAEWAERIEMDSVIPEKKARNVGAAAGQKTKSAASH